MQTTRRFWATVSLVTVLLAGAWVLEDPFLLVGAATIGASLVARQLVFVYQIARLSGDLDVIQSISREEIPVETDLDVILRGELPYPAPVSFSIMASPPITAASHMEKERTITIDEGNDHGMADFSLQFPVAGEYRFAAPTVSIRDPGGFFETSLSIGSRPEVTVLPSHPRNLHVGIQGERVTTSLGMSKTGSRGIGFDPAEIREFVPGDTIRHIDWKATARMNSLYVREFEEKTDVSNIFVVDHRSSMGDGTSGRTKLDYVRQVALGFVANAQLSNTPCGLYGVGNEGLTVRQTQSTTEQRFDQIRTELLKFSPTETGPMDHGRTPRFGMASYSSSIDVRTATRRLGSSSAFDTRLRPFLESRSQYLASFGEKPLYQTVRERLSNSRGTIIAVFFTDDTNRLELREAVKFAQRRYERVLVFVTPTVLFEPMELVKLSRAYERYVDFENFRSQLASASNVNVYEVGPQDRLTAILSNRERSQQTQRGVSR